MNKLIIAILIMAVMVSPVLSTSYKKGQCEICGRPQRDLPYPLSLFHILDKNEYPRLRLYKQNLLLACWSKQYYIKYCHNIWHHDMIGAQRIIEPKIKALLGDDYREKLLVLNKTAPKLTDFQLNLIFFSLKKGRKWIVI